MRGFSAVASSRERLPVLAVQAQRRAVHAVAEAGGLGPVGEDVAEVGTALAARDFVADHAVGGVGRRVDDFVVGGGVEAGPAAVAVKLFLGGEQFLPADHATIHAGFVVIVILAGEGGLGSFLLGYVELFGRETRFQIVVWLFHFDFGFVGRGGAVGHCQQVR